MSSDPLAYAVSYRRILPLGDPRRRFHCRCPWLPMTGHHGVRTRRSRSSYTASELGGCHATVSGIATLNSGAAAADGLAATRAGGGHRS